MISQITNEMVVAKYGDNTDGIFVYKNGRSVGYLTDLRIAYHKKVRTNKKQKEYSNRINERRKEEMPDLVEATKEFLENHLAKYDANVFVNISQPNVHMNGNKCYIICDPIGQKFQLGIYHTTYDYNYMSDEFPGIKCSPSSSSHHILFRGLERDDILEIIKKLCKN
ncbi:inhibitor of host transcription [Morganella phage vB_MmoM_MP1]|uniref:Inhibitor of host transcription n=1 Tax=Morganella phage vB_MmoM_MP1 TaxID=1852628 RepID=A0A192YAC2_9CAUD|nr:inhibitor of host transcription [Morganella phage vB_MmoM_MP1]ANM46492.1 inhibitor of host transcription [Morganella phage vB_MmoM_MP1]